MIFCIIAGFLLGEWLALKAVTIYIDGKISSYSKKKIDILVELGKVTDKLQYPLSIEDRKRIEQQQIELVIKKTVIESIMNNLYDMKHDIKNGKLKAK